MGVLVRQNLPHCRPRASQPSWEGPGAGSRRHRPPCASVMMAVPQGSGTRLGPAWGTATPVQRNRRTGRGRARIPLEGGALAKCPISVCRAGLPLHTRSSGSASRALSPAAQAPRPGRQGERAQRKPRAPRGPTPQQQPLTSFCARAGHTQGTPGTHTHRAHRAHGAHAAHTHLPLTENSGARGSLEGSGSPFTSQAKGSEGLLPHRKSLPNTNAVS